MAKLKFTPHDAVTSKNTMTVFNKTKGEKLIKSVIYYKIALCASLILNLIILFLKK